MKSKITALFTKIWILLKNLWSKKGQKKVWIPAVIIGIFLLAQLSGGKNDGSTYVYTVQPKEFVQTVSLTGKVIAAKNVDMAFEIAGRVSRVTVKVGDLVKKGQVIASLENGDYSSALQKNYALASSESARLKDIQSGGQRADVMLAQNEIDKARREVVLNKQAFLDQLQDIYSKADDAVRFKIDNSFRNPRSVNPEFMYLIDQNSALRDSLTAQRIKVGEMLSVWGADITGSNLANIRSYITTTQKFINDVNSAISIVAEKTNSTDSTYSDIMSKKSDIGLARTSFATAVTALNQAELAYNTSVSSLQLAEQRLEVKSAGTNTDLDVQKANVESAQAGIGSAQAMIAKTIIRAPFDGVITKIDVKEGEISSPNTPVVGLLNDGEYQIETFVSENDIAKLSVDQKAKVTLDAYGRDQYFDATIISVDPAETIKDGVSTYRTKIQFTQKDPRIKSGMTANIEIETDRRQGVLSIPQSALFLEKGVKKVNVLVKTNCYNGNATTSPEIVAACSAALDDSEAIQITTIKTGEIGNTGDIEVLEGITADQYIIYNVKAK